MGKNIEEAIKWLTMAAEHGSIDGMIKLSDLLYPEKAEEAKKWLRKAIEAGSQEAVEKLAILEIREKFGNVKVGSIIKFGNYPQNTKDKKEPIEWRVLAVKGGKALVISQYALDCKKYNEKRVDTSWEKCTLRKWLNSDFLNSAFNPSEQNLIQLSIVTADKNPEYDYVNQGNDTKDKIFLLSAKEAEQYFKNDEERKCNPTKFTVNNGAYKNDEGQCWWWLRSLGYSTHIATIVLTVGSVGFRVNYVDLSIGSVRPALWINLKS